MSQSQKLQYLYTSKNRGGENDPHTNNNVSFKNSKHRNGSTVVKEAEEEEEEEEEGEQGQG